MQSSMFTFSPRTSSSVTHRNGFVCSFIALEFSLLSLHPCADCPHCFCASRSALLLCARLLDAHFFCFSVFMRSVCNSSKVPALFWMLSNLDFTQVIHVAMKYEHTYLSIMAYSICLPASWHYYHTKVDLNGNSM